MPHSSSATLPIVDSTDDRTPAASLHAVEALPTRQVLVRSAMDGLQRFKQSWKSVMLLKAGVGLGQVIVLVVLLILATILTSPLFPDLTQNQPSEACPHPQLFQAWMAVQIVRLTVCWSVSCWMCIRAERKRRRRQAERELEEREATEELGDEPVQSSTLPRDAESFSSRVAPSLVHSTSSTSTLIAATLSAPSTPRMAQASSSRLDLSSVLEMEQIPDQDEMGVLKDAHSRKRSRERSALPSSSTELLAPPHMPQLRERHSTRSLRQARELLHGEAVLGVEAPAKGFAGWLDRHALSISRSLGVISTIFFILGNILLFYPPPSDYSCYSANPLLWWGVLTVTAVGWVLLLQVFFVVVIVGLGGAVVLNALQRLGVIPAPAEPEQPRAAQPDPLTPAELSQIKLVCYLPESSPMPLTRLPVPPIYLSPHQATCAICQENFEEPKEGRTILLKADKLRQLGCSHVYHVSLPVMTTGRLVWAEANKADDVYRSMAIEGLWQLPIVQCASQTFSAAYKVAERKRTEYASAVAAVPNNRGARESGIA